MTGRKIPLKGWRVGKDGKLKPPAPRDASAARRQRPGGSAKVKVKRG